MGNIKTLQQPEKITPSTYGLMDNLTYAYSGNKLTKVTDAVTTAITNAAAFHFVDGANVADEYAYDINGNTATYVYDGAGNKLSVADKSDTVTTKIDYVGNKVYSNGTLGLIHTEEGYVTLSGTTPTYYMALW